MSKRVAAKKGPQKKVEIVEEVESSESEDVYDSEDGLHSEDGSDIDDSGDEEDDEDEEGSEDEDDEDEDEDEDEDFEVQSSSDEGGEVSDEDDFDDDVPVDPKADAVVREAETKVRQYREAKSKGQSAAALAAKAKKTGTAGVTVSAPSASASAKSKEPVNVTSIMNTDDLSSDDEEGGNTIGRVPLHWYDAFDHIGYNVDGEKVVKRKGKDRLDMAIANSDDPVARRTIYDMYNDREVVLTPRDMELIRRIQAGTYAHPEFNDTPDYVDYFSSQREVMPLSARPEPKHKFLPSKWELMKVRKIVRAMREGRYKTIEEREKEKMESNQSKLFMIWNDLEDDILADSKRNKYHLPAPKMPLPGHAESYNPPPEYLLTKEEEEQMNEQDKSDRQYNFVPKEHSCLRHVAGYKDFVKERFERCLDLYLCPRKLKMRLNIDPQTLVPRLPRPRELKPFPNTLCLQFLGHTRAVRSISLSPDGQYLVSASDDATVRLWEVDTCLCRRVWTLSGPVSMVAWNPNPAHHLVAAVVGDKVVFISTGTGDADNSEVTESLVEAGREAGGAAKTVSAAGEGEEDEEEGEKEEEEEEEKDGESSDSDSDGSDGGKEKKGHESKKKVAVAKWKLPSSSSSSSASASASSSSTAVAIATPEGSKHGMPHGPRLELHLGCAVTYIAWHHKGDYIGTLASTQKGAHNVAIHQLSRAKSQCPFRKPPGRVQAMIFHPSRPYVFVVTQQQIKVYNLVEQRMVKKLRSGCKWLSSVDIHPSGDHLLIGSYDRRVVWFDMDLSSTPYKTLKFHESAVRAVQYHKRFPLMASASDDGTVHIFHSTVYSDLTRNPLIVPLKVLRGHGVIGGIGVLSIIFHPRQPWIFTSGADSVINLFQDI